MPPPTFLFTDIEGSTALWERAPEAMKAALARHDACLREAIASHAGRIVKTTGDGVMAVFDAPQDALRASIDAQRRLQSSAAGALALNVRMGLHTGEADERDGDYFGAAPTRAARIMAAAYGGQVLVSAATAALLRESALDGATLRDLGEHRLKGLSASERLAQVVVEGLRGDFPPLASQAGHNLPAERDAFVGRRDVLDAVRKRFDAGARLVSVLAIGGAGKTRVVTRYGHDTLGEHSGGVWFCDLTQARSQDGIVHAVAQGLDVPLGKEDPLAQLGHAIASRGRCLVILDNFEQVARHAAATVGAWLDRAGAARFLVATREALGVPGEQVVVVPPLGHVEAIELFRRRAEAVQPSHALGPDDDEALAKLVDMLDGLPLAIELAAARIGVMSPRAMLGRMSERFKLLASSRGRSDRQAALRATFDWSWELLTPAEKSTLAQLSVFEGGFTLDAAEAVVDVSALDDAPWAADLVQSLLHKSLVRKVDDDRFDLLVSVREYAAGQLIALGGAAARTGAEERHGVWATTLDRTSDAVLQGVELDNLVAACRRAIARGDAPIAVAALERAWAALALRGPFRAAADLAAAVGAMGTVSGVDRARVDLVAGQALSAAGSRADAGAKLDAALAGARTASELRLEGEARLALGRLCELQAQRAPARQHLDEALAIARAIGDASLESTTREYLGQIDFMAGSFDAARTELAIALDLARRAGDRRRESRIQNDLGVLCVNAGPLGEARAHFEASLAAARAMRDREHEGVVLCNLGQVYQIGGRDEVARATLEEAQALNAELGHARVESIVLCNLGIVCERLGNRAAARSRFERSIGLARDLGDVRSEGQFLGYLGALEARDGRTELAFAALDRAERALDAAADRASLALVRCFRAEAAHLARRHDDAREALAQAEADARNAHLSDDSEIGLELARVRKLLATTPG